jgi:transposase
LFPRCSGTVDHHAARDALWAKFSTAAPARREREETAQAIGPSRGGQTTKIHALTDVLGRLGALLLTPGTASDVTVTPVVLTEALGRIRRLSADKRYDADWLRADLRERGITPIIPGKRGRNRMIRRDKQRYRERWRIEATFNRLKDFRRIATRYDKLARNYASAVALASVIAFWC